MVRAAIVLCVVIILSAPSLAAAQSPADTVRRAQLIEQAQRADAANDHVHALELAEQAAAISMSTSLRLFTAEQQMAVGHVADAMVNAEACVHEAQGNPALANRAVVLAECTRHVTELGPRIGHLVVRPPERMPPGFTVSLAGATLDPTMYGVARPVAIGTVVLDAHADGRTSFHREIAIAPGANVEIVVEMPRTVIVEQPAASAPPPAAARSGGHSLLPYVVLGVGAVSLIVAGVADVVRDTTLSQLNSVCTPDPMGVYHCPDDPTARSQYSTTQTFDVLATTTAIVGAAALVGGVVWWVVDHGGGGSHESARATFAPLPGGGAMVGAMGVF